MMDVVWLLSSQDLRHHAFRAEGGLPTAFVATLSGAACVELRAACGRRIPEACVLPARRGLHRPCARCRPVAGLPPAPTSDAVLPAA